MASGARDIDSGVVNCPPDSGKDERLDFCSEKFDPLLALRTPGLVPPVKDAKVHDNIHKYWSAHHPPAGPSKTSNKSMQVAAATEVIQRKFLETQMPVKVTTQVKRKNIRIAMEKAVGPLMLVKKCKDERLRVKVVTRHSHGVRGFCECFIVAFDKYLNLALQEVTETWTRPKKRKVPAVNDLVPSTSKHLSKFFPEVEIIGTTKKTETCRRFVKELIIRGEQIVIISTLNENI